MELIILPFCIPLLLLGRLLEVLGDASEPALPPTRVQSSQRQWLQTWFAVHGRPGRPPEA